MNSNSPKFCGIVFTALTAVTFLSQSHAAPVVFVTPSTQNVANGAVGSVDIIVNGLTQALGGFQFDLTWNAGFLSGSSFVANPSGLMGPAPLDLGLGLGVGGISANAFVLADAIITEAALAAAQGTGFILGRLTFTGGPSNGFTPLNLSNVVLSNFSGGAIIGGVTTRNGTVCVGGNCVNQVPTPTTPLLVMAALGALALTRKHMAV